LALSATPASAYEGIVPFDPKPNPVMSISSNIQTICHDVFVQAW
jgi:hypothetical protein